MKFLTLLVFAVTLGFASLAQATNNIDLSMVPARDSVQLTIYNSEDLTLVRERRLMSFKRGRNQLQFSWVNTLIDPSSVEIRFPSHAEQVTLADTTFSHARPQTLIWNIDADVEGAVQTEITYFTSGLTWTADYTVMTDPMLAKAQIEGFVRVHNNSGEDYQDAEIRVVVGQINLVEKIAELARVPVAEVGAMELKTRQQLRQRAVKKLMQRSTPMPLALSSGSSDRAVAPKEIIKEGLSEYFIYRIGGMETVPNGWSKRLRSFDADNVPVSLKYRYRRHQYGAALVRIAVLNNDADSGLGSTPLPNGKVTVFRRNTDGGLSYIVHQAIQYVPVGDDLELNLGPDRNVVFNLDVLASKRDDLWLKLRRAKAFKRVGDGSVVIDHRATVAGWQETLTFRRTLRNFSGQPIDVEIRQRIDGDATWRGELDTRRHDYRTVEMRTAVGVGATTELLYEVVIRHGRNAKQRRLEIERADVAVPGY